MEHEAMKIQVIGLPCSGKTTTIKEFISDKPYIEHIDINNFEGKNRWKNFKNTVRRSRKFVIAESACGIYIPKSEIVRLDVPIEMVYARSIERDNNFDEDYLSLLESNMMPAKYTATNQEALIKLLINLFSAR